jgi:tetratricopeptide (TPR) repeat protein
MRAVCIVEEGQVTEGVTLIQPALEALRATGSSLMVACSLGRLADALTHLGRVREALSAVSEALDAARAADDRWFEAELHRIQGEAFLAAGDRTAAEASLRQAGAVARSQGAALWELRAVLSLAPVLGQRSAHYEARDLLEDALGRIRPGAEVAEVQRAETLRDTLRHAAHRSESNSAYRK